MSQNIMKTCPCCWSSTSDPQRHGLCGI